MLAAGAPLCSLPHRRRTLTGSAAPRPSRIARRSILIAANGDSKSEISDSASLADGGHDARLSVDLVGVALHQTLDQVQQLVADLRQTFNRNARELVEAKERSEQEWDRAQVEKEKREEQAAADKAALAKLTEEVQDLQWGLHERTETVQGLEKQLAEANAEKERALAELRRVKEQPPRLNSADTQSESKKSEPGSSLPAAQIGGSLGCNCRSLPGGRPCDGRCVDNSFGSRFVRLLWGKWECVDLDGRILPQEVFKLHTLIRKLQQQQWQEQQQATQAQQQSETALYYRAQEAERKLTWASNELAGANRDAAVKQERADKQVKQLQAEQEKLARHNTAAEARITQLATDVLAMKTGRAQLVEDVEVLVERLASRAAQEEETAAELRLSKEMLQAAEARLAQLGNDSSVGLDSSSGEGKVHLYTGQRCAGGSFPMGFGSVEQRECLDKLSVATEQLAAVLVQGIGVQSSLEQDMLKAAMGSLEGTAGLVSSWDRDRDSCAAALHHHVLITALDVAQQQVDWYTSSFVTCLTSCPESGRTDLHGAMQQLQQAKSSTLFLVAQQQAPSHPATREAVGYVESIRQYMQGHLEQQLGLIRDHQACIALRPQLVAVAAAMTRINLLLASLQTSCPGLQLVSRLEEWGALEGQGACDAPVRQLLGKVEASLPLFLVRPGLVCAAAGGGRQVLVRQQAVQLVPDPAWLEQQRLEAEATRKQQEEKERLAADEEHRRKQEAQRLLEKARLEKEKQEQEEKDAAEAKAQDEEQVLHEEPKVVPGAAQQLAQQHQSPGVNSEPELYYKYYEPLLERRDDTAAGQEQDEMARKEERRQGTAAGQELGHGADKAAG